MKPLSRILSISVLSVLALSSTVVARAQAAPPSKVMSSEQAAQAPEAPLEVRAEGTADGVAVYFVPGADNGSPILSYTALCIDARDEEQLATALGVGTAEYWQAFQVSGPVSTTASTSPLTVNGLGQDVYACAVTAANAVGTSAPSETVVGSPSSVPAGQFSNPQSVSRRCDRPAHPAPYRPGVSTNRWGDSLIVYRCRPVSGPGLTTVHASFRPAAGDYGVPVQVGVGMGAPIPVVSDGGTASVYFVTGSLDEGYGLAVLDRLGDGTFTSLHVVVDAAPPATGARAFTVEALDSGDTAIGWVTEEGPTMSVVLRHEDGTLSTPVDVPAPAGMKWHYALSPTLHMGSDDHGNTVVTTSADSASGDSSSSLVVVVVEPSTGTYTVKRPLDAPSASALASEAPQASGTPEAIWRAEVGGNDIVATLDSGVAARVVSISLDNWEVRQISLPTGTATITIDTAVGDDGYTAVAWQNSAQTSQNKVWVSVSPAGQDFTAPVQVGPAGPTPSPVNLSVDRQNNTVVAWSIVNQDALSDAITSVVTVLDPPAGASPSLQAAPGLSRAAAMASALPKAHPAVKIPLAGGATSVSVSRAGSLTAMGSAGSAVQRSTSNGLPYKRPAPATPPRQPQSAVWDRTVRLQWTAPSNTSKLPVSGYVVQYSINGRNWTTATASETRTSTSVTGLTNGVRYRFRVAAITTAGTGKWLTINATPRAVPGPSGTPVAALDNGRIQVTWTAPAQGADLVKSYQLQVSVNGRPWSAVGAPLSPATFSYTLSNPRKPATYKFRVMTRGKSGQPLASTPSNSVVL